MIHIRLCLSRGSKGETRLREGEKAFVNVTREKLSFQIARPRLQSAFNERDSIQKDVREFENFLLVFQNIKTLRQLCEKNKDC